MHIVVTWENATKTVIRVQVTDSAWTIDDMRDAFLTAWNLTQTVDQRVNMILDMRASNKVPTGFLALMRWGVPNRPKNAGDLVVLGGSLLMEIIHSVVHQSYVGLINIDYRVIFANSLEDEAVRQIIGDCKESFQ